MPFPAALILTSYRIINIQSICINKYSESTFAYWKEKSLLAITVPYFPVNTFLNFQLYFLNKKKSLILLGPQSYRNNRVIGLYGNNFPPVFSFMHLECYFIALVQHFNAILFSLSYYQNTALVFTLHIFLTLRYVLAVEVTLTLFD